jgi:hypothetical protein
MAMLKQVHWSRKRKSAPTQSPRVNIDEFPQTGKYSASVRGFIGLHSFAIVHRRCAVLALTALDELVR